MVAKLSDFVLLDPAEIRVSTNPRSLWNPNQSLEEAHVEWILSSYEENEASGREKQEKEILVRKIDANELVLIGGHYRLEAAKRYNAKYPDKPMKLRARLVTCNEEEAFVKGTSDNRGGKPLSVIDQAHAHRKLREEMGWTDRKIAQHFGVSHTYPSMITPLLNLPFATQFDVHTGKLSLSAALTVATSPAEERNEVLATTPNEGETKSQAVVRTAREAKIKRGESTRRTPGEIKSFWEKVDSDNNTLMALAGLEVKFIDGSITDADMLTKLEGLL